VKPNIVAKHCRLLVILSLFDPLKIVDHPTTEIAAMFNFASVEVVPD
jgi:hypothetical protein